MATRQANRELERQGVFARVNAMTVMSWKAAMGRDKIAVRKIGCGMTDNIDFLSEGVEIVAISCSRLRECVGFGTAGDRKH